MEFQVGNGRLKTRWIWGASMNRTSSRPSSPLRPHCSKKDPLQNGDGSSRNDGGSSSPPSLNLGSGDRFSTDWDKAWSSFKKRGRRSFFSQFFLQDKYVTWDPKPRNYPPSEEVDPIKRTERSVLMLWTSPQFTLVGAIVVVSLLLIYTIQAPI